MKLITVLLLVLVLSLPGCPRVPNPCAMDFFMLIPTEKELPAPPEKVEC